MEVLVRAALPEEAAVVSEVLTEAAVWIREAGKPLWQLNQIGVDQVTSACEAGCFFLAWSGTTAVGTMRLTDSDPDFWPEALLGEAVYVHRLAVRRSAAGGQVSTALLQHATKVARRRSARYLRLDVLSDRARLRRVYEDFGFEFHSYHTVRSAHVARYQLETRTV